MAHGDRVVYKTLRAYTAAGSRPAFSNASISPWSMALLRCTRRLCPRPMIRPSWTRTEPIGMPPSASPASASATAAFRNSSIAPPRQRAEARVHARQRSNYSRSNSNVLTTRIRFTRVLVGLNGPDSSFPSRPDLADPGTGVRGKLLSGLLGSEEVIVCRVVDASRRPGGGLRTTGLRRDAAHRIYPLDTRDLAERAFRADGPRGKQQPRDGIGHWRIGTFLHRTQDLAAISRFPMGAGVVSPGPVSTRVEKIGFGSHKRPRVPPDLIRSRTAFVDLHALRGNDHRQQFVRARFQLIRHLDLSHRWLRGRAGGDEEDQQGGRERECPGHAVHSLDCELMPNVGSGARSASAPLRGSALAWPHALPTTQRLSVGTRRTPFASAYLLISSETVCQMVLRWIGDASDSMVRRLAEVAGRSSTNSSIERYSRVNVCRSIATPAKPACENERSNTCSSARLKVPGVSAGGRESCSTRRMTLIGTLVNGTFSGGPHTAAANRPPGTSNSRILVRARTRFGRNIKLHRQRPASNACGVKSGSSASISRNSTLRSPNRTASS